MKRGGWAGRAGQSDRLSAKFGLVVIAATLWAVPAHTNENCVVPYTYPELEYADLEQKAARGVLHIDGRSGGGTAFLIDRDRGIYLTAAHVVMREVAAFREDKPQEAILGTNAALPGKSLLLKVIEVDENPEQRRELAVLQLVNETPPEELYEFQMALRDLAGKEEVRFIGYGTKSADFPLPRMSHPASPVEPSNHPILHRFVVAGANGGDSGGPVFLSNGSVIGIMVQHQSGQTAVFHSLTAYLKTLLKVEPALRDERLVAEIFAPGSVEERRQKATKMLLPGAAADGMSNIEFAAAIAQLELDGSMPAVDRSLLDCPLYFAAAGRDLGLYGSPILREKWRRDTADSDGKSIFRKAEQFESEGNTVIATALYELAGEKYRAELASLLEEPTAQKAIAASLYRTKTATIATQQNPAQPSQKLIDTTNFPDVLTSVAFSLGLDTEVKRVIETDAASTFKNFGSDTFSVALHDYGLALTRANRLHAEIGGGSINSSASDWATRAGALGAVVAYKPAWQRHNFVLLRVGVEGMDPNRADLVAKAVKAGDEGTLLDIGIGADWKSITADWTTLQEG